MKTHFLVSETPQKFGAIIEVLCGKTLANPEPVISIEVGQKGWRNFFNPLHDCSKCSAKFYDKPLDDDRLYIYGVIEGQEVKNTQAESAA